MSNPIHKVSIVEPIKYHLSEDEKKELGQEMAQQVMKIKELTDQKKIITTRFGNDVANANALINAAAQKLESGFEMRSTDCEEHHDYVAKKIYIVRLDTGETIRQRDMTSAESQQEMFEPDE